MQVPTSTAIVRKKRKQIGLDEVRIRTEKRKERTVFAFDVGVAGELGRAGALGAVVDGLTLGVDSAGVRERARVLAPAVHAGLVERAVDIRPTSNYGTEK